MHLHALCPLIRTTAIALAGASLAAADFDAGVAGNLQIHGFASQGALKSDDNNYLTNDTQRGSVDFNEFGLAVTDRVSDRMSIGAQLFARDLGTEGQDQVGLDWAYGDYRWRDELGVRAGIIHAPLGLYGEDRDIDLDRTEVLLPQLLMYNENYRDVLESFIGAELYGDVQAGAAGSFDYDIYGGGNEIQSNNSLRDKFDDGGVNNVTAIQVKDLWGAQLIWNAPLSGLRLAGTYYQVDWDFSGTAALPAPFGTVPFYCDARTTMQAASLEYSWHNWMISSEFCHGRTSEDFRLAAYGQKWGLQEGWYGMVGYRFNSWLAASACYTDTKIYGNTAVVSELTYQKDASAALRFDLDPHWLLKLEGHYINGDALLLQNNNPNEVYGKLGFHPDQHWWLAVAKTTFSF
jgi:hypothetical protein